MAKRIPTNLVTFGNRARTETVGTLEIKIIGNWIDFRGFGFDPFNPLLHRQLATVDTIHWHQTHIIMASVTLLNAGISGKPIFTTHVGVGGYGLHRFMNVVSGRYSGHLYLSRFSRKLFGHDTLPNSRSYYGDLNRKKFYPERRAAQTLRCCLSGDWWLASKNCGAAQAPCTALL